MGSSMGVGFMAVFAVSGSVVLIALQVHKRLLSDFMKKIEFELGSEKYHSQEEGSLRGRRDGAIIKQQGIPQENLDKAGQNRPDFENGGHHAAQ
ncbi:hypothetical protein L1049_008586 [Liquidambar formosana]|uniref:Uncharacterized protein n=1 Tax=Liquidambar formosana TaxID=63359 RepID=A0AAP0S9M7_LIQFO